MPDTLVVCWVASTPSTCVWRHPCIVLAAQLVLRHLMHFTYLLRTKLPRMAADSLYRIVAAPCPIRQRLKRLKRKIRANSSLLLVAGGAGSSGGGAVGGSSSSGGGRSSRGGAGSKGSGGGGGSAHRSEGEGAPLAGLEMPLEILQVRFVWFGG